MKKKFITNNGDEVTFGDLINWKEETVRDNFYSISKYSVTLTEDNVDDLIKDGIIKIKEEEKQEDPDYLGEVLRTINKKLGLAFEDIIKMYPNAAAGILLKELATIFNKKAGVDVKECDYCFGVDNASGAVKSIETSNVVNWELFVPFVKKEDAQTAKCLLNL